MTTNSEIRCRLDGHLQGVHGPLCGVRVGRETVAQAMGWADSGDAEAVISGALSLLGEGKAVRLTSHAGWCEFQPLAEGEDGARIPASSAVVYNADGSVFSRKVS
jgi:hypothetical protein